MRSKGKVAETVCSELQLKAVRCLLPLRRDHHPGIINEEIELCLLILKSFSKGSDGLKAREIDLLKPDFGSWDFRADFLHGCRPFCRISAGNDHIGSRPGERQSIFQSQPARPGDDDRSTMLLGNVSDGPLLRLIQGILLHGDGWMLNPSQAHRREGHLTTCLPAG